MPLYTFFHNLLNVLVQIANKMGFQKRKNIFTTQWVSIAVPLLTFIREVRSSAGTVGCCEFDISMISSVSPTNFMNNDSVRPWSRPYRSFPVLHSSVVPFGSAQYDH
jgi:hypothetical protein